VRQQLIVAIGSILLLLVLFFFGRTKPYPKEAAATATMDTAFSVLNFDNILLQAKKNLTPQQQARLNKLEHSISRGDVKSQKIAVYSELAAFWKDSAKIHEPWLYYMGEKAKLENSEKSLNFAGQSYLEELKTVTDPSLKNWMASQAQGLFDQVLQINPASDSAKIGWGSTFIFGASGSESPMEGIMKIREVAQRDSNNMYAQFMLGYGGMMTGQFDKAAERLERVVRFDPGNQEAIFLLAEAYERQGDKASAVKWYAIGKKRVTNPELIKAIDEKINSLQ
jgi:tetratricopeptide (TPR) repeat protein